MPLCGAYQVDTQPLAPVGAAGCAGGGAGCGPRGEQTQTDAVHNAIMTQRWVGGQT